MLFRSGEVLPVEKERLIPVRDGDILKLGNEQVLTFLDAPGHAPHELCIYESRNRGIFVGDAVGHHIEGTDIIVPITPPPSFDFELYIETIYRLIKMNASLIYYPHSGADDRSREKLETSIRKLQEREAIIAGAAGENKLGAAVEMVISRVCHELEPIKSSLRELYDYWTEVDIPMSASEHVRHYIQKHGL